MELQANEGYLYLAYCETGHYKIGISKTPNKRVKHFDTIMPVSVDIVHSFYCEDYRHAEKRLHGMFDTYRTGGEWFDLPSDVVDLICSTFVFMNGKFCTTESIKILSSRTIMRFTDSIRNNELVPTYAELPY